MLNRLSLLSLALLVSTAAHTALAQGAEESVADPILKNCLISVKDEVKLPAQEPGVLVELTAKEGLQVKQGDLLGRVDDSKQQIQKRQALAEQEAALEEANNDINVRYSKAASKVAEAEYDQTQEANSKVSGTFPQAEVRRLKLAWHRAFLQIEQSELEQRMASLTAKVKAAAVEAADNNIRRSQLISPIDGEVVELLIQAGEWVNPGDPIMRIIRFDTLRVEGFVQASQYDPGELVNRPVTVEVELARGRRERQQGKVVYVDSRVQAGGEYRVWAEITNQQENGQWLFRPGLIAAMRIHLERD